MAEDESSPIAGLFVPVGADGGIVRTSGYGPGRGDVEVAGEFVRRCDLRIGDAVAGTSSSGHLTAVASVNGVPAPSSTVRPGFFALPATVLPEPIRLSVRRPLDPRLAEKVLQIGHGCTTVLDAPADHHEVAIRELLRLLVRDGPDSHKMFFMQGASPQVDPALQGERIFFPEGPLPDRLAEIVTARAMRLTEQGHDVMLVTNVDLDDDLLSLGRVVTGGATLTVIVLIACARLPSDDKGTGRVPNREPDVPPPPTTGGTRPGGPLRGRAGGIFVSYRRGDTAEVAGRLADRLADRFGESMVFIDVDSIEPGVDFVVAITTALESCRVLVVLIGPAWNPVSGSTGTPRLDDPDDLVRLEVEIAVRLGLRIIPVLVDDAVMPSRGALPDPVAPITRVHSARMRFESFRADSRRLVELIERSIEKGVDAECR